MCEVLSYMLENVILLWTSKTGGYRTLRVGFVAGFWAYRSGCVGFWAVFRCYKAERWGLDSL